MVELSDKQFLLLEDIDKEVYLNTLDGADNDDLNYLHEQKLIEPIYRPYTQEELLPYHKQGIFIVGSGSICGYKTTPLGKAIIYTKITEKKNQELMMRKVSKDHKLAMIGAISGLFGGVTGLFALLMQLWQNTPPTVP